MDSDRKPRNLGRASLIGKLRERGLSRRRAGRILDFILEQVKQALAQGDPVEFPFGWLERAPKQSPRYEGMFADEPMQPYKVAHFTDAEGVRLLGGLERMLDDGLSSWTFVLSKGETPPYNERLRQTPKPRRPRGRPRKTPAAEVTR